MVTSEGHAHQQQAHGHRQPDGSPHQASPPVRAQENSAGVTEHGQDRQQIGEAVEGTDPPLGLYQLVRLEEDEARAVGRRDLVEDGDPPLVQGLFDLRLNIAQVERDLAPVRGERSGLVAGQQRHHLLVGGTVGRDPESLEGRRLDDRKGDPIGQRLEARCDRSGQEPGLLRQGIGHPTAYVNLLHQMLAQRTGHGRLDRRVGGQWPDSGDIGVGVQHLVASEYDQDRDDGQQAGQKHEHPCRSSSPPARAARDRGRSVSPGLSELPVLPARSVDFDPDTVGLFVFGGHGPTLRGRPGALGDAYSSLTGLRRADVVPMPYRYRLWA